VATPAQLIRETLDEAVDLVMVLPGPRSDLSDGEGHPRRIFPREVPFL
jgi:hypothetical protein